MDQERKSATDKVVRSKKIPCEATDTYINIQTVLVLNKMWYFVDLWSFWKSLLVYKAASHKTFLHLTLDSKENNDGGASRDF